MTVTIIVDGQSLDVEEGMPVLQACLANDIYIPHLCFLPAMKRAPASCRLCFVEIQGRRQPVTACTEKTTADMVVTTDTPAVRRLQKSALQLLLSVHDVDCKHCHANRRCELQRIAKFLKVGLKSKRYPQFLKSPAIDTRHPCLDYYPNRCVLCGKCVSTCLSNAPSQQLTFAKRGFETIISVFLTDEAPPENCQDCRRCADVCPVGALAFKDQPSDTEDGHPAPAP